MVNRINGCWVNPHHREESALPLTDTLFWFVLSVRWSWEGVGPWLCRFCWCSPWLFVFATLLTLDVGVGRGYSTGCFALPPLKFPMSSFPSIPPPDSLQLCSYFVLVRGAVSQEQFQGVSQPAAPPGYCLGRTDWLNEESSTPSLPTQGGQPTFLNFS